MEMSPKSIDVTACFQDLNNIEEVEEIRDFHVWALSVGKMAMSCHVKASNPKKVVKEMN